MRDGKVGCFISASSDVDVGPFERMLKDKGISVRTKSNVFSSRLSIQASTEREIGRADFLLAVIARRSQASLYYEIGMAYGLKVPILLVLYEGTELPPEFAALPYARFSSTNPEGVKFVLEQFLVKHDFPSRRKNVGMQLAERRPMVEKSHACLKEIPESEKGSGRVLREIEESIVARGEATDFEGQLAGLFSSLPGVLTARRSDRELGADLALWIDEIQHRVGNPILVEIKRSLSNSRDFERAANQLREDLRRADSSVGLLIYIDREHKIPNVDSNEYPYVYAFEVNDLLSSLRKESLAKVILSRHRKEIGSRTEGT